MLARPFGLLLIFALTAGCSPASTEQPIRSEPVQVGLAQSPEPADVTLGPPETVWVPAAGESGPLACTQQQRPTLQAMHKLVVELTRYAPFDYLTGDARAVAEQWHVLTENGWPPPEWENYWASRPWLRLDVSENPPFVVTLLYHDWKVASEMGKKRFEVVCAAGYWQVVRTAENDDPWWEIPTGIPGQNGELTEDLAWTLAWEAFGRRGPWLAQVATGQELESGRHEALRYVAGKTMGYLTPWPGTGKGMRLTALNGTSAVGQWLDEEGQPTGESVLFVKVDGLWKVENHTINGEWLDLDPTWNSPLGAWRDELTIFGLELGMSRAEVQGVMGLPDQVEETPAGTVFRYELRRLTVRFDNSGKVREMSTETGATHAGILVGSPASMVKLVYGDSPDYTYVDREGRLLRFAIVDGRVTGFTVGWSQETSR